MIYIGCDPGKSGAIAFIDGDDAWYIKNDGTLRDLIDALEEVANRPAFAYLERVSAMPKQGVSSTFKFGQSYGQLEAILTACRVPFERITPTQWQTAMGCRTKGDKNVSKARAQELFPNVKVIHANADALLLAEYARRAFGK